jgi:hypothetical protein
MLVEINTDRSAFANDRNVFAGSSLEAPLQQHIASSTALPIRRYIHSIEFPALSEITQIERFRDDWQDIRDMSVIRRWVEEVEVAVLNAVKYRLHGFMCMLASDSTTHRCLKVQSYRMPLSFLPSASHGPPSCCHGVSRPTSRR